MPGLQGTQGCTKCHMLTDDMDYNAPQGFHHADDTLAPVVGGDLQDPKDDEDFEGFFRFLHGHQSGDSHGVCGIEDGDWQASSGSGDHNEYLGYVQAGAVVLVALAIQPLPVEQAATEYTTMMNKAAACGEGMPRMQ